MLKRLTQLWGVSMKSEFTRNALFIGSVLLLLGSIAYICYALSAAHNRAPIPVTFVFSGAEMGYLEPCGCSEGQLGGIARRASFLRGRRARSRP